MLREKRYQKTDQEQFIRTCSDCPATYIGETGRNLTTRLTEHKRATKKGDLNNNIAEHHLKASHANDFDSATCLTNSTDYYQLIYFLKF